MRTNIEIDDDLMARAIELSGLKTKRATVEQGIATAEVERLRGLIGQQPLLVGDLILLELLQGVATESAAHSVATRLRRFDLAPMLDPALAVQGAANYRLLRRRGIAVRKIIDLIIATFCIANGHALLTSDRDFLPTAEHLGLKLLRQG